MQLIIQLLVISLMVAGFPSALDRKSDGGTLVKAQIQKRTFYGMAQLANCVEIITIKRLAQIVHMRLQSGNKTWHQHLDLLWGKVELLGKMFSDMINFLLLHTTYTIAKLRF